MILITWYLPYIARDCGHETRPLFVTPPSQQSSGPGGKPKPPIITISLPPVVQQQCSSCLSGLVSGVTLPIPSTLRRDIERGHPRGAPRTLVWGTPFPPSPTPLLLHVVLSIESVRGSTSPVVGLWSSPRTGCRSRGTNVPITGVRSYVTADKSAAIRRVPPAIGPVVDAYYSPAPGAARCRSVRRFLCPPDR